MNMLKKATQNVNNMGMGEIQERSSNYCSVLSIERVIYSGARLSQSPVKNDRNMEMKRAWYFLLRSDVIDT